MSIVAAVGVLTAVFAATMGLVQTDIKKILAYSTISQLGYMFLALGVGAFSAGLFHVMTHAFFKALLFLGAGSVIHGMHDEQDIRRMGNLKSHMPVTYKTFLIGSIAIAGIPPLSGFFSKDDILWKAFSQGSPVYWVLGWLGAGLTAFYMFRLVSLTFDGPAHWKSGVHPHESPKLMTVPLIVLAVLSIVGGWIGIPASLGGGDAFGKWLDPVFESANARLAFWHPGTEFLEYVLMLLSVGIAVGGIMLARNLYLKRIETVARWANSFSALHTLLFNKYYVDELYNVAVVTPVVKGSEKVLWKGFDVGIIDGIVNGVPALTAFVSDRARRIQTGVVQNYAMLIVFGIAVVLGILLWR
jgi:NADH-quinone oxidoreductase subunit L